MMLVRAVSKTALLPVVWLTVGGFTLPSLPTDRYPNTSETASFELISGSHTTSRTDCGVSLSHQFRTDGRVEWTGHGNAAICWWQIDITTVNESGLVLQFDEVALRRGPKAAEDDTVTVYLGEQPDPSKELTRVQGSLPVFPILVPSALVLLRLEAYSWQSTWDDVLNSSYQHHSRFSLTYTAQSLHSLPPPVAHSTVGRYNCSSPYHIPQALRCDMVEQCAAGEDENNYNCSYKTSACGDWISLQHKNLCLKVVSPFPPIHAIQADADCEHVDGHTVDLFDPELKKLVSEVVSKSGYSTVLVGLTKVKNHPLFSDRWTKYYMYRFMWMWLMSKHLELDIFLLEAPLTPWQCAVLRIVPDIHFWPVSCFEMVQSYACAKLINKTRGVTHVEKPSESFSLKPISTKHSPHFQTTECSDGSFVHGFLRCTKLVIELEDAVEEPAAYRLFPCSASESVRYTYVCDGIRGGCEDSIDEKYCNNLHYIYHSNAESKTVKLCSDLTFAVPADLRCDGIPDCPDMSDEVCNECAKGFHLYPGVGCLPLDQLNSLRRNYDDAALREMMALDHKVSTGLRVMEIDKYGFVSITSTAALDCPETHFRCLVGLCVPSYMMKNDILDCPVYNHEDEAGYNILCPGYFRCAATGQCIHWHYVCDGQVHCVDKLDEFMCDCPGNCTCAGREYTCQQMFQPTTEHRHVIYLDISHVFRPAVRYLIDLPFLHYLNMSSCGLKEIIPLDAHLGLTVFDLSFNDITDVSMVRTNAKALKYLNLSYNPLSNTLTENSFTYLVQFKFPYTFHQSLLSLSLHQTNLQRIQPNTFKNFSGLIFLDIGGNPVQNNLKELMFTGLVKLRTLIADDRRVCCLYTMQYSSLNAIDCQAPDDELSSCEDLLESPFLRVTLWLQSFMAVLGNAGVFIFRVFVEFQKTSSFRVLVSNLSVADLLMGLYMMVIGAADAHFSGQYIWKQAAWTESVQCKMAGFLAVLCSEMSAFIICIITVDRLLVLRYPFKKHLHLTPRSAMLVCAVCWTLAFMLAVIPLFPVTQHWKFYSQTGICLPLPITRRQFPGRTFSFAVFIVLNFVLFLLISVGQVFNYVTIRNTPTAGRTDRHQQDMTIARRLFLIVFTDFCCWFPVGVMGLLAARGIPVPGQVNVWTAVFVLPLNSALNPFLYTLNVLMEKYQKNKQERLMKRMLKRLLMDIASWPEEQVLQLKRCCDLAMTRFQATDSGGREGGQVAIARVEQAVQVNFDVRCL